MESFGEKNILEGWNETLFEDVFGIESGTFCEETKKDDEFRFGSENLEDFSGFESFSDLTSFSTDVGREVNCSLGKRKRDEWFDSPTKRPASSQTYLSILPLEMKSQSTQTGSTKKYWCPEIDNVFRDALTNRNGKSCGVTSLYKVNVSSNTSSSIPNACLKYVVDPLDKSKMIMMVRKKKYRATFSFLGSYIKFNEILLLSQNSYQRMKFDYETDLLKYSNCHVPVYLWTGITIQDRHGQDITSPDVVTNPLAHIKFAKSQIPVTTNNPQMDREAMFVFEIHSSATQLSKYRSRNQTKECKIEIRFRLLVETYENHFGVLNEIKYVFRPDRRGKKSEDNVVHKCENILVSLFDKGTQTLCQKSAFSFLTKVDLSDTQINDYQLKYGLQSQNATLRELDVSNCCNLCGYVVINNDAEDSQKTSKNQDSHPIIQQTSFPTNLVLLSGLASLMKLEDISVRLLLNTLVHLDKQHFNQDIRNHPRVSYISLSETSLSETL